VDRRLRFETLRNFALAQELLEALRLLASHGIPALAWKGPGLAAALYGSFVCRSPADLDGIACCETPGRGSAWNFSRISPPGGVSRLGGAALRSTFPACGAAV
jgi:hypothetical protein